MTNQEAFNVSVCGLLRQGQPSFKLTDDGRYRRCKYRGRDGCKCAIGFLIPDDKYNLDCEDKLVQELDLQHYGLKGPSLALLYRLQRAHDGHYRDEGQVFCRGVARDAGEIAKEFGLSTAAVVNEFPQYRELLENVG